MFQQCIYVHEWLPCEFCQQRHIDQPCVKLLGPKSEARNLTPSRVIPTAIDAVISADDALLLAYAYSDHSSCAALARILACEYGNSIPCPSLRHALFAHAVRTLPARQF